MIAEGTEADFIRRHLNFKRRQMQGLQDLLRDLAASGSVEKIVIRPHPVENHDVWREWGRPLNIDVRYEGSANNWMMAADAVVHPGCTTGIEGLLLDRAVFSYVPDADSEFIGEQDRASEWVSNADGTVERPGESSRAWISRTCARASPRSASDCASPSSMSSRLMRPTGFSTRSSNSICRQYAPLTWASVAASCRGSSAPADMAAAEAAQRRPTSAAVQKFPGVAEEEISAPLAQWAEASILTQVPQITRFHDRLWVLH